MYTAIYILMQRIIMIRSILSALSYRYPMMIMMIYTGDQKISLAK